MFDANIMVNGIDPSGLLAPDEVIYRGEGQDRVELMRQTRSDVQDWRLVIDTENEGFKSQPIDGGFEKAFSQFSLAAEMVDSDGE